MRQLFLLLSLFTTSFSFAQLAIQNQANEIVLYLGVVNNIKITTPYLGKAGVTISCDGKIVSKQVNSYFEYTPERKGNLSFIINFTGSRYADTIRIKCIDLPEPEPLILCGGYLDGTGCKFGKSMFLHLPQLNMKSHNLFTIDSYDLCILRKDSCVLEKKDISDTKIEFIQDVTFIEDIVELGDIVVISNLEYHAVNGTKGSISRCYTIPYLSK